MSDLRSVPWRRDERGHIITTCPGCGKDGLLAPPVHTVATDGAVFPSFDCPLCPFHEWVRLEGWPAPGVHVPPAEDAP